MKRLIILPLMASVAALGACSTYPVAPAASVASASGVCGNYGYVDANNDGFISGAEWNLYRTSTYGNWDTNHDGRISQSEFENCYRAGGFYQSAYYNPDYWNNYWSAFDTNHDGYLSNDEYWSAPTWARIDRNGNGRIDANEWTWWNG